MEQLNMEQTEPKEYERPKKFTLNEPCVIVSIVGLSLLTAMTNVVQARKMMDSREINSVIEKSIFFNAFQNVIPVPGLIMLAFLSELSGRKPIFIGLSAMSALTSVLAFIPPSTPVLEITNVLKVTVNGGLVMMNMLCIPEYCRPRHRFICLIVNHIARMLGVTVVNACKNANLPVDIYFEAFGVFLSLACLGSACAWPESPYWLAARGRRGDAAYTLRKLRGEGAEPELSQIILERTPGPIKLICLSLFCVLALASVTVFSSIPYAFSFPFTRIIIPYDSLILFVIRTCFLLLASILSYRVKHKVIYLTSCLLAVASAYILSVWLYTESYPGSLIFQLYMGICNILFFSALILSHVLASELLPLKYNTLLACSYYVFSHLSSFGVRLVMQSIQDLHLRAATIILLFNTMVIPGLIVSFVWAPETKDKSIFEVQKSYVPEEYASPEQGQMLQPVTPVQTDEAHAK